MSDTRSSANTEPQLLSEEGTRKVGRRIVKICKRGHDKDIVGRHGSTCKACYRLLRKPETIAERQRRLLNIYIRRAEAQAFIASIKAKSCMDCSRQYNPWQMDFDHRDPTQKKYDIARLVNAGRMKSLKLELLKCDLVCSNCHRNRTYKKKDLWIAPRAVR